MVNFPLPDKGVLRIKATFRNLVVILHEQEEISNSKPVAFFQMGQKRLGNHRSLK